MNIQSAIKVVFTLLLSIMFYSCSEPLPDTRIPGSAIKQTSISKLNPRLFGNWSPPQLLGSKVINATTSQYMSSFFLDFPDLNNVFTGWAIADSSGGIDGVSPLLVKRNGQDNWTSVPILGVPMRVEYIDVKGIPGTDTAISVWIDNGTLYTNRYTAETGWGQTSSLGNANRFVFSEIKNNKLLLIWYTTTAAETTLYASEFDLISNWTAPVSTTLQTVIADETLPPISIGNGNYLFVWSEQGISSVRFNPLSGWSTPTVVPLSNLPLPASTNSIKIAELKNAGQAMLFLGLDNNTTDDGIYTTVYQYNSNGSDSWEKPARLIDSSTSAVTTLPELGLQYDVHYNSQGKIALLWIAESSDTINQYNTIQVKTYQSNSGWSKATYIAPPLLRYPITSPPQFNEIYMHEPQLSMTDSGQMYAAWIETDKTTHRLLATRTNENNEWMASEIVTAGGIDYVALEQFILKTDNSQNAIINFIWSDTGNPLPTYNLLVSELLNPVVISPINPQLPKPATHINSTDNCNACHSAIGVKVDHNEVIGTCIDCHNGNVASGKNANHIATSDACDSCHTSEFWKPVIFVDHTQVFGLCADCHNGISASGKNPEHIQTTNLCEACHSTYNWIPAIIVDHNEVLGPCMTCHNNINAMGKPVYHIFATDMCDACHSTTNFIPAIRVDHSQLIGTCNSCHDGIIASGKSLSHIKATNVCEACHATTYWAPVYSVDHTQILGACVDCHNGVLATGKYPSHINATDICDACHLITSFVPYAVDHSQVIGTCESCHTAPASHIAAGVQGQCDNCHDVTSWFNPFSALPGVTNPTPGTPGSGTPSPGIPASLPQPSTKHIASSTNCLECHRQGTILPVTISHADTLGSCQSCHDGVVASGKSSAHINTTENCTACHITRLWKPATRVDHKEVLGSCEVCHDSILATGKSTNHIATTNNCDTCHSTQAWIPAVTIP